MNNFILKEKYINYLIVNINNDLYNLYIINKIYINKYKNLFKSKYIIKPILEEKSDIGYYYYYINKINSNKSEIKAIYLKKLDLAKKIFNEYSYNIILKKKQFHHISNITKVLDNRFRYLEFRIREIELNNNKNDISWIILANVHSIMDVRVILFDLLNDILSSIDKEIEVEYGLVFNNYYLLNLNNNLIEPSYKYYYAPISMLYARIFLDYNHIINYNDFNNMIKSLDIFNLKYFCFMILYIMVLSLELPTFINNTSLELYLKITKDIDKFVKSFNSYFK